MVPLLMLGAIAALIRFLGARGLGPGVTWRRSVLYAMSITSIVTGAAVFTRAREDMARMVPDSVPDPEAWVVAAGTAQMAGGAGLAFSAVRPVAAGVLGAVVLLKLPANWKAARQGLTIRGRLATPPWMRIPNAIVWLLLIVWVARAPSTRRAVPSTTKPAGG